MRFILLLVVAAGLAIPAFAKDNLHPEVYNYTLNNGLELVVIPDRRAPVVTHMIWYKVGSADDPPGKSGLAHSAAKTIPVAMSRYIPVMINILIFFFISLPPNIFFIPSASTSQYLCFAPQKSSDFRKDN